MLINVRIYSSSGIGQIIGTYRLNQYLDSDRPRHDAHQKRHTFPEKTPRFESILQREQADIKCFAHRSMEQPNLGDAYHVSWLPTLFFRFRQSETASEADHEAHGQIAPRMDFRGSFRYGSSRTQISKRSAREGGKKN